MINKQTFPTPELLSNFLKANSGKWFGLIEPGGFEWSVADIKGYSHAANDSPVTVDIELLDYPVEVEEYSVDRLPIGSEEESLVE